MKQYIDKTAIIAEIERRKKYYENIQTIKPVYENNIEDFNELLSFINTLEVKEINSTDAFIKKARKYFYKELPNFRSFMESGTAFIKNFETFIQGE